MRSSHLQVLTLGAFGLYALMFFVGMLPYVFLPISDIMFPQPMSWGDCSTLTGFIKHFIRAGARLSLCILLQQCPTLLYMLHQHLLLIGLVCF